MKFQSFNKLKLVTSILMVSLIPIFFQNCKQTDNNTANQGDNTPPPANRTEEKAVDVDIIEGSGLQGEDIQFQIQLSSKLKNSTKITVSTENGTAQSNVDFVSVVKEIEIPVDTLSVPVNVKTILNGMNLENKQCEF
jgi:hypothetical protein